MSSAPLSNVGGLVHDALRDTGGVAPLPFYARAIDEAFASVPPTYADEKFGNLFKCRGRDASWVASLLASDCYMEAYSAVRLWQYASRVQDDAVSKQMRRHARDEAKHSKMFASVIFRTFPSLDEAGLRRQLDSYSPDFERVEVGSHLLADPSEEELLNSMLLINLYEVKALVLCKFARAVVLAHTAADQQRRVSAVFEAIERDECFHIRYSAAFLEQASERVGADHIREALSGFQEALNGMMLSELEDQPHLQQSEL
jgi:hypothetical protein